MPQSEWVDTVSLRARIAAGPFTTRGLTAELAARGIKTDRRAVWFFLHAEGMSFKKKPYCRPSSRSNTCRYHRPLRKAAPDKGCLLNKNK